MLVSTISSEWDRIKLKGVNKGEHHKLRRGRVMWRNILQLISTKDMICHFQQEVRQGTNEDEVEKEIYNDGSNTSRDANYTNIESSK